MNRQSRQNFPDWLQTVVYVVGLSFVCWLLLKSGVRSQSEAPAADPSVAAPVERVCGHVVLRCVASAELQSEVAAGENCSERRLRQQLDSALENPIERGECKGILQRIGQQCPDACTFVAGGQLVVPAAMETELSELANEAGICFGKGRIPVTVRGTCVSK